jgi:hypothetical protein
MKIKVSEIMKLAHFQYLELISQVSLFLEKEISFLKPLNSSKMFRLIKYFQNILIKYKL